MNDFARPSFRRRTYLLTGFQSRFAFSFVVSSVLIVGGAALVLYWFLKRSPREAALFINLYTELDRSWIFGAGLVLLSALTILFIVMVMTLHRVAGPIFVMTRYLNELAAGRYPVMRPLRASDELTDFFDALKNMSERLQRRGREEARTARDLLGVLATLSPGPQHQDVVNRLKAVFADKLRAAEPASEGAPPARAGVGANHEGSAPRAGGQTAPGPSPAPSGANHQASRPRAAQGTSLAAGGVDHQASTLSRAPGQAPPRLAPAPSSADHQASTPRAADQAPQGAAPAPSSADHQASTPARAPVQAPPGLAPARAGVGLNRESSTQVRAPVPVTTGDDE